VLQFTYCSPNLTLNQSVGSAGAHKGVHDDVEDDDGVVPTSSGSSPDIPPQGRSSPWQYDPASQSARRRLTTGPARQMR
jgi:hypothetical protein